MLPEIARLKLESNKPKPPHHIEDILHTTVQMLLHMKNYARCKFLGKHFDHQTEVGSELIPQLGFTKCQRAKALFILYAPKNLYHGNLCQLGQNELKRATGVTL
jgi:hypothetical protein